VARSGHTVIRAGPVLILFGGEDGKGKKLHDLHMFDLKSSTWLPLNYKGAGPSPRSNHVAALYDDRILLIFGGQSKSKTLNDVHALDFETVISIGFPCRFFLLMRLLKKPFFLLDGMVESENPWPSSITSSWLLRSSLWH
jgi:hypothetical protein